MSEIREVPLGIDCPKCGTAVTLRRTQVIKGYGSEDYRRKHDDIYCGTSGCMQKRLSAEESAKLDIDSL